MGFIFPQNSCVNPNMVKMALGARRGGTGAISRASLEGAHGDTVSIQKAGFSKNTPLLLDGSPQLQGDSPRVAPSGDSVRVPGGIYVILPHIVLFQRIYCIASGVWWLIGPRGNTYLFVQRSHVLSVGLCRTSHLAYGHLGF